MRISRLSVFIFVSFVFAVPMLVTRAAADDADTCEKTSVVEEKIAACTRAIFSNHRWDAAAFYHRSVAFRDKGDYNNSIADASEAIFLDPKYAEAYLIRGKIYEIKGNYNSAIADYKVALSLDPNANRVWSSALRDVLQKLTSQTASTSSATTQLPQQQIDSCLNRTNSYAPDVIISGCTAAIQSPGAAGAWAYGNLGSAYALKGDYDRAIANFTQAIKLKPNDPKYAAAHYNRGMAYRSKGYMTEAQALGDLDEALRLAPNAPWSAKAEAAKAAINAARYARLPCIGSGCPPRRLLRSAQGSNDDSSPPEPSPSPSPQSAPNTQFAPVFLGREGSAL